MVQKKKHERDHQRRQRKRIGLPGKTEEARKVLATSQTRQFEVILTFVEAGNYVSDAIAIACISKARFFQWMDQAKKGVEPYVTFREQLNQAQARAIANDLDVIALAGARGDWRAVAWRLERMYPDKFGAKIEVTKRDDLDTDVPVKKQTANLSKLSIKDRQQLRQLMAKANGNPHVIEAAGEELSE